MNTLSRPVHIALSRYGHDPLMDALRFSHLAKQQDSLLSNLDFSRIQLCPQLNQDFSRFSALTLRAYSQNKNIEWRLHGSIQLKEASGQFDICHWPIAKDYFHEIEVLNWILGAPIYSAHAGKRCEATVNEVIRYSQEMTEQMGFQVAIEGHYPDQNNSWLISSWQEYRQLMESGAFYALDLSHLNILATQSKQIDWGLVKAMLENERCLEVHLSDNDGVRDSHLPLTDYPWWWPLLDHVNPDAALFSEGRVMNYPTVS